MATNFADRHARKENADAFSTAVLPGHDYEPQLFVIWFYGPAPNNLVASITKTNISNRVNSPCA